MNSIRRVCAQLKKKKEGAFMGFTTFGYPSVPKTLEVIKIFQDSGVDIVELGVPFSDPLADGPVIQKSSLIALQNKVSLQSLLDFLSKHRKEIRVPVALLTYLNPVFRMGLPRFFTQSEGIVDAVGTADLLLEDAAEYRALARKHAVDTFFFATPTTSDARAKKIGAASTGFVYYVSVSGITGTKTEFSESMLSHMRHTHQLISKPLFVGFGVGTPEDARRVCTVADGVIVGSAIIKKIEECVHSASFAKNLGTYLRSIKNATVSRHEAQK